MNFNEKTNANPILLSHWIGRFGNRMHQYAYGSTYSHINNVEFILPSEWEGTYLFKKKKYKILDNNKLAFELNTGNLSTNQITKEIKKYYPNAKLINPEHHPENYIKHDSLIYFDNICAYGDHVFEKMDKDFLIELFEFSDLVKNTESYKYWEARKGKYDIAHLRRDDIANAHYNKNNHQGYSVVSMDSYYRAFDKFGYNRNDIEWVSDDHIQKWHKDKKPSIRLPWSYPTGSQYREDIVFDWLEDFLKLYFARTIFRANSSFSWWASFLAPKAKVYSPVLDKQSIYGLNDKFEEIDVDFVEGNEPHWMYSRDGLKKIIIKENKKPKEKRFKIFI